MADSRFEMEFPPVDVTGSGLLPIGELAALE
jgi:hypothetical protein